MKTTKKCITWLTVSLLCLFSCNSALTQQASPSPTTLDQGARWTDEVRYQFYSEDQGSRIMPLVWMRALKQPDGSPFLADSLSRYGYLNNPKSPEKLPIGFSAVDTPAGKSIGLTCAACHTRDISVSGELYRVDGGPAIVDFEALLLDLDSAIAAVLANDENFLTFAQSVLGSSSPDPDKIVGLKSEVSDWFLRFDTLVKRALAHSFGGPGRVDAIAMIYNRLSGLDIGSSPDRIIASNIQLADAPVRYPFLWNAAIQDRTQWTGFAANGNDILGLARNLGEVYGVFAEFQPVKKLDFFIDFRNNNSANFQGLNRLEQMVRKIGAPKWPFPVDQNLANKGKEVFNWPTGEGGCVECHNTNPGKLRFLKQQTWATPNVDVGSDSRAYDVLNRDVATGVLAGAEIPLLTKKLGETDKALNVLTLAVLGTILEDLPSALDDGANIESNSLRTNAATKEGGDKIKSDLQEAFKAAPQTSGGQFPYESRALHGIWAAAPYLHNGSVPTLRDLLKPSAERPKRFKIGPEYDIQAVGIALEQTKFDKELVTTGCGDRNSGNSNCGHEFGTSLPEDQKRALLEYLKSI